jgi:3-phenylpropionate/trans-cinnamate dioxygenase ferredoxin component
VARVRLGPIDQVPDNGNRAFDVAGRAVLVARTPLGLFAVGALCSHQQQSLEGGRQKACFIFCPLHGMRFDLRDGSPTGKFTDRALPTYAVGLDDGELWVDPD